MENIKSVIETGKETETSLVSQVETMGEQESSVMEVEPKEQESSIIETEGGNEMESSAMEVEPKEQESVLSETGDDDNEGKSRETTWIEDLQVENDATVAGTLRAHKLVTDMADAPEKDGHGFYSSGAAYDYTPTHIDIDDSKQAEDGIVGLSLRNAANKVLGVVSKLYTGISEKDRKEIEEGSSTGVNQLRAWMENALAKLQWQYLSKEHDDTTDHNIGMGGLAVNGNASVSGDASINHDLAVSGNAMLNAVRSTDYDNSAEQGFSIEKDGNGKYQAFLTNLTIWGKAVFHELEVRKLSYAGGNINLSRAGSKIVKAVPVKKVTATSGTSSTVTWEECEVTDADCAGWKCYLLADNGTTATMNDWQEGDQARCETMGEITSSGSYENTANRSYWRTIPDGGVSTANEKIYGTKVEVYTDADGKEQKRETQVELYDGQMFAWVILGKHSTAFDGVTEGDASTSELQDVPQAGDTIVQDGNRHRGSDGSYDKTDRQNVIALETSGDYAPRIACYANITEYKHTVTKDGKEISLSVFETSPRGGTKINSSRFVWTSDDGSTINIINYRGDWSSSSTYHKNDQVNHNNAVWVCVANSGVDVKEEPSDNSKVWRKEISGGKDGKSARRTAVVNLTSDSGTVFNGSYEGVLLRCSVVIDGKSMGGRIPRNNFSWTRDGQLILPDEDYRYRLASSSDALDLWKCSVKIPKRLLEPIELTALRADGNSLIFHASEDVSKMTLYLCRKWYCRISKLNINRNAWGFRNMVRDYPIPLPFTSLGDNNYSVDMSQLLSSVESHNIVLHKTAKVTTGKTALKHGKHTYWLKQGADGKYHAWGRYGVWLADGNYTPVSTVAKCKIYVETDSDTATTGTASLSV